MTGGIITERPRLAWLAWARAGGTELKLSRNLDPAHFRRLLLEESSTAPHRERPQPLYSSDGSLFISLLWPFEFIQGTDIQKSTDPPGLKGGNLVPRDGTDSDISPLLEAFSSPQQIFTRPHLRRNQGLRLSPDLTDWRQELAHWSIYRRQTLPGRVPEQLHDAAQQNFYNLTNQTEKAFWNIMERMDPIVKTP